MEYKFDTGLFPNRKIDLTRFSNEIRADQRIIPGLMTCAYYETGVVLLFKCALNVNEVLALESIVFAHSGEPLPPVLAPTTDDHRPRVVTEKPDFPKMTVATHDWTDPTTWYTESNRALNELAVDAGDHKTFVLANQNVIDTFHGLGWQEDFLKDALGNSYRVSVTVNGAVKYEKDPHNNVGDFVVDYVNGRITFYSAMSGAAVRVTYHYATTSGFILRPPPGKTLVMDIVETQFAEDVQMNDSIVFQPYGVVDYFAPQLVAAGYLPSGFVIPLGDPLCYKTMTDIMADSLKSYPPYPALGKGNWRGTPNASYVFDWDYISATNLYGAMGMFVRVSLQHDVPFDGWFCTTTFYCKVT